MKSTHFTHHRGSDLVLIWVHILGLSPSLYLRSGANLQLYKVLISNCQLSTHGFKSQSPLFQIEHRS
ncbi:hypothetical protein L6452_33317 [Arctium lappa]|uniref:Uncharacterized protein n=1 Tax=Arctium lappa TaxID=4217 RepID=A0ACB8Z6R4_ARCLA|nr:hypothetical protein L6452_33317 [Arctium lappa]